MCCFHSPEFFISIPKYSAYLFSSRPYSLCCRSLASVFRGILEFAILFPRVQELHFWSYVVSFPEFSEELSRPEPYSLVWAQSLQFFAPSDSEESDFAILASQALLLVSVSGCWAPFLFPRIQAVFSANSLPCFPNHMITWSDWHCCFLFSDYHTFWAKVSRFFSCWSFQSFFRISFL